MLATAIAETSLTIEGVRTVIDSGLRRAARFDPRTGMSRLVTVPVSAAAAEQRRGRAGRVAPGRCERLWTEAEHRALPAFDPAEIRSADLAPMALELAVWGIADPCALSWLDPPPAAALEQAWSLLTRLGALDGERRPTAIGRRMARIGVHPRLARMIVGAATPADAWNGCRIAALLSERDPLAGRGDADLRTRLEGRRTAPSSASGRWPATSRARPAWRPNRAPPPRAPARCWRWHIPTDWRAAPIRAASIA